MDFRDFNRTELLSSQIAKLWSLILLLTSKLKGMRENGVSRKYCFETLLQLLSYYLVTIIRNDGLKMEKHHGE